MSVLDVAALFGQAISIDRTFLGIQSNLPNLRLSSIECPQHPEMLEEIEVMIAELERRARELGDGDAGEC